MPPPPLPPCDEPVRARERRPAAHDARTLPSDAASPPVDPALLFSAVELIDEAVLVTSLDLDPPGPEIIYVNPGLARMTGYSAGELIGRTPRLLQGPGTDRAVLDRLRRDLAERGEFAGEITNRRKDGTPYVIAWRIKALRNAAGEPTHWLSVQRDITRRQSAEENQRRLLREVDHRAKNALALVQGIVRLSRADDADAYAEAVQARVDALARAHALLADRSWGGLSLKRLLEAEVAPYGGGRVAVAGPDLTLHPQLVQPIALVAHEMARNAAQHGALSVPAGRVELSWSVAAAPAGVRMLWTETGGPPPSPARAPGFGTMISDAIVRRQLRGRIRQEWGPSGLQCEIEIPFRHAAG